MMEANFRDDELVKVQGKQYPVVGGRLRLAHEQNNELSITTNIVNIADDRAVIQATIRTEKGSFSGLGNASLKRDRLLSNALIELAETRAIARALRFAGYGVEFTGFEEMPEDVEKQDEGGNIPATKSQLETVASIAKRLNISSKELHDIMYEVTGKKSSRELTSKDVSKLLISLKGIKNKSNASTS